MATELPDPLGDISDIGAFRLVRQIGRGGMCVVYLAERRSGFEQQVAIKIMPRFAIDDASRERFAQERRILAQLRHSNICSILDGGELADGTPWLAMEYVPGESLCAWCARHRSDSRERIALFLQLCDAVQYAHRNLVIHRDLKDSNVMIDERGAAKLLDSGIAKSLAASQAVTSIYRVRKVQRDSSDARIEIIESRAALLPGRDAALPMHSIKVLPQEHLFILALPCGRLVLARPAKPQQMQEPGSRCLRGSGSDARRQRA